MDEHDAGYANELAIRLNNSRMHATLVGAQSLCHWAKIIDQSISLKGFTDRDRRGIYLWTTLDESDNVDARRNSLN